MLLKRISYHNFRPFIGDQEIILTPDEDPEIAVPISSINAVSLVYDRYNDGSGFSVVE